MQKMPNNFLVVSCAPPSPPCEKSKLRPTKSLSRTAVAPKLMHNPMYSSSYISIQFTICLTTCLCISPDLDNSIQFNYDLCTSDSF